MGPEVGWFIAFQCTTCNNCSNDFYFDSIETADADFPSFIYILGFYFFADDRFSSQGGGRSRADAPANPIAYDV